MSDKYPSQLAERFQIRLPDGMRDQIRKHAEANNRSMNSEIISLLETALWGADYDRVEAGLEPFGAMSQDDRDRILLRQEDAARRAADRNKALADHGVFDLLSDLGERLERIEDMLEKK